MIKQLSIYLLPFSIISCSPEPTTNPPIVNNSAKDIGLIRNSQNKIEQFAFQYKDNGTVSQSIGSVSNGSLINGKLFPFIGKNYEYFDKNSYLAGKGFTHSIVKNIVLNSYKELETSIPNRQFKIMECSHQHGGKLQPHRTHQNGTSIDFMMPLIKDNQPYYELDNMGFAHYLLSFNDQGEYSLDSSISIDFESVNIHLLSLENHARELGYKIKKVIIKIELKDELFAAKNGKKLKESNVYLVRNLSPLINSLHDEHYHVDFEKI